MDLSVDQRFAKGIEKHKRFLLVLLGIFWFGLNLWALQRYPTPHVDEAWIGSIAVEFSQSGRFGLPIFTDIDGSSENYVHMGRAFAMSLATVYTLLGVGFWQGRLFALVGVGVSGWLLFKVGSRLYGKGVGLAAAIIFLWSWRVFSSAHLTRPEPWVIAGSLGCLLSILHLNLTRSRLSAFGVGLLSALVVDIYLTGVYASIAATAMMMWMCRQRKDRAQIFWYALGGFTGFLYWVLVHSLPDPVLAVKQWQVIAKLAAGSPDESAVGGSVAKLAYQFWTGTVGYTRFGILELICLVAGLFGLLLRRSQADGMLLLWIIPYTLTYIFVTPGKGPHQLVLFSPLAALIVAAGLPAAAHWLGTRFARLPVHTLVWVAVAGLCLTYAGGNVALAWRNRDIDYQAYSASLKALIPAGSHVLGESGWYFALSDFHYTIDENLYFNTWAMDDANKLSVDEILHRIIQERNIDTFLVDERLSANYPDGVQTQEESALWRYVAEHCRIIGSVSGIMYGAEWTNGPAVKTTNVLVCP